MAINRPKTLGNAAYWSLLGGMTQQIASFAIFVVLARLLVPEQFGLAALAAGIMEVLLVLFRAGIPELIIQDENPSRNRLATAFWLSLTSGFVAAGLLVVIAPYLAEWYALPELELLCKLFAVVCALQGSSLVHEALIRRDLNYRALTLRLGAASLVSGVLAVALAFAGAGVYALVAQRLLQALSMAVLAWWSCPWRPSRDFLVNEAKTLLTLGPRLSAGFTLGFLTSKALEAILAATLGAATLGLFRVASRTIDMISAGAVAPFVNLALPVVARSKQVAGDVRQLALLVSAVLYLGSPIVLGVMLLGDPLVVMVFGEHWKEAGAVLAMLSPLILLAGLANLAEGVLSAFNRSGRILTLNGGQLLATAASVLLTAPYGPVVVAFGQVIRSGLFAVIGTIMISDLTPLRSIKADVQVVPLIIALCAEGAAVMAMQQAFPNLSVLFCVAVGGGAYLAALTAYPPLAIKTFINKRRIAS